jgi:DNA-binding LacI/PurR family transcriptional regulator
MESIVKACMLRRMPPSRRATLADVAVAAGVSRATASRALGDNPHVSQATRARVWAAAERLSFEPNHLARSLRRGSTMGIGIVVPDVATAFYAAALKGAQERLEGAGYHALVVSTERAARRERAAIRTLGAHRVDGLIVATSGGYEDIGVPTVFFDNVPAGAGAGAVALENAAGITTLVQHLAGEHGHRRIAYLGPPDTGPLAAPSIWPAARERIEAFHVAVGRAGLPLPPAYVRTADPECTEPAARATTLELLDLAEPPTAIVAGTDTLAMGVLGAARERGLATPGDLALVSFDEPPFADLIDPPVTSLDRHDRALGRRAADLLLDALQGAAAPGALERMPLVLRPRRSCGCA